MTPEQIDRVEQLVRRISADDAFATAFYERLFAAAPDTAAMFPDVAAQRGKLQEELATLVSLLLDLPRLEQEAAALGVRHRSYGVRARHFRVARDAMDAALTDTLGDDFTPADREAWRRAYGLITELMQA
jgi:nitric oxide dioxygenase